MDWNKDILRTIQPETDQFFTNTQAGHEKRGYYDTVQIADYILPPMVMKTQKINLERLHMVFSTSTSVNLCIDNIHLTIYPSWGKIPRAIITKRLKNSNEMQKNFPQIFELQIVTLNH